MTELIDTMTSDVTKEKQFNELHAKLIGNIPEEELVVISGTHAGMLFNILNYRIVALKRNHVILFATNSYQSDQLRSLVEKGFFDAAVIWDGSVGFVTSSITKESDILAYFDSLMMQINLKLEKVSKAFLFSDCHDQIGSYLDIRGVDVVPVETAIGAFEWKWRYESFHNEGRIGDDLYTIQKRLKILCGEEMAHRVFANESRIYNSDSFDNTHSLEKISNDDKKKIVSCFHDASIYDGKSVILLNSFGYLARGGIDENGCKLFLKIIERYFCPFGKKVLVKLHPYSYPVSCFSVDGMQIIDGKENIDVLSYTDYRIACAIDFESTSIDKIINNVDSVKRLGLAAYSQYRYYPIAEFIRDICKKENIGFSQNAISNQSWSLSSLAESEDLSHKPILHMSREVSSGKIIVKCISDSHYKPVHDGIFKLTVSGPGCTSYSVRLSLYTDSDALWNSMVSANTIKIGDLAIQLEILPFNKIIMGSVIKKRVAGRARLVCPIKLIIDDNSSEQEPYFEVADEYENSLDTEVSDPFVFAALVYAMINGCDIRCETPVSDRFKHMIEDCLIPTIVNSNSIGTSLHNVKIYSDSIKHMTNGIFVGTGLTGGVDSLYTSERFAGRADSYKLTHSMIIHWGGWFDDFISLRDSEMCASLGTRLVNVGTNISSIFKSKFMAFEFWVMACVIATRRMWKDYLCSSAFSSYTGINSDEFDVFQALAAYCLSGDGINLSYDGGDVSRLEKTKLLSNSELARNYLSACFNNQFTNCSWCSKCIRTMIGLDLSGNFDRFYKVFNVDEYRKETDKYIHYAVLHKDESFFKELYDEICVKYPNEVEKVSHIVLPEGSIDDFSKLTLYYSKEPQHPYSRFRIAKMYRDGKYVPVDSEKYMRILNELYSEYPDIHDDVLKERTIALKKVGKYEEILEMFNRYPDKQFIKLEVARMYRDGRKLPKDIEKAMTMMLELADSGNVVASNEYASIVMDNKIKSRYEDAYNRCSYYAKHKDSGAQFRISKMYEFGIYVPKDLNSALSWMRRSNLNRFPLAKNALVALEKKINLENGEH